MTTGPAQLAAEVIEAINSREPDRLARVLDERSEVVTGRTIHTGNEAIVAWARREYDHLVRRYAVDDFRIAENAVLAIGSVEYAWIDGGEVADSSPIAITIELDGDRLRRLRLQDDTAAALSTFEA